MPYIKIPKNLHKKRGPKGPTGPTGRKSASLKHYARNLVYRERRAGRLKPAPCETCGATLKIEAHHPDYSKPLEVRWFCRAHHALIHIGERRHPYSVTSKAQYAYKISLAKLRRLAAAQVSL